MPHVSRIKLDKKTEKELEDSLELSLAKFTKKEEMHEFISSLLSSTEKQMLAKRLAIVILLREGVQQKSIANTLNVTEATVSRMALYLEVKGKGYDMALQKLKNEKYMQELKKLLLKIAGYSIRPAGGYVKPEII